VPLSLGKTIHDAHSGLVIFRSHMHSGLKRNSQLMPGVEWLELLCRHIPDRFEHLVRCFGWYLYTPSTPGPRMRQPSQCGALRCEIGAA
jgi:hypothetical protein